MNAIQKSAHDLLKSDKYNKAILPELTKCVQDQIQNGWYDLEINLAILKFYQFHPNTSEGVVELEVLVKILGLALTRLMNEDFRLCMFLIPEQYQNIDSVVSLTKLAEKLENCQYVSFFYKISFFN
jgi:translation initiation factor 3 subunit K